MPELSKQEVLQKNFENWYRYIFSQANGLHSLQALDTQCKGLRVGPSTIVSEKFNNWILSSYNEVFITFLVPKSDSQSFLASDCYMPHQPLNSLMTAIRLPWVPLHPRLLFRVFFQQIEAQTKEQLQLRFFFEDAEVFNREALKFGSEILGAETDRGVIELNLRNIQENSQKINYIP